METAWEGRIGGLFPLMEPPAEENGFLAGLVDPGDDLRHMMSGRCGIMLGIEDWMLTDQKRVAYLPAYTCETVSGCFDKTGYQLLYYDVDKDLRPLYDESLLDRISLFLLCGYYGFTTFDLDFAQKCRQRGIGVMVDTTHSLFSAGGVPEVAHYVAGSFRKWLSVPCGGFAIKRSGAFGVQPQPLHEEHLGHRRRCYQLLGQAQAAHSDELLQQAGDAFWDAEMLLRDIYDRQGSDDGSIEIVKRTPIEPLKQKRRENFAALLDSFPDTPLATPVFTTLPEGAVPSHFPVYTERREELQQALKAQGISSTVYWPVPPFIDIEGYPGAKWVYQRILSLPCDQRYGPAQMRRICQVLAGLGKL